MSMKKMEGGNNSDWFNNCCQMKVIGAGFFHTPLFLPLPHLVVTEGVSVAPLTEATPPGTGCEWPEPPFLIAFFTSCGSMGGVRE